MKMLKCLVIFCFCQLAYQISYPVTLNSIQWVYQQNWIQCDTQELIKAENCGSESIQQECYNVPTQGLCLIQNGKVNEVGTKNLVFYAKVTQNTLIQVMINSQQEEIQLSPEQQNYANEISLDQLEFSLKVSSDQDVHIGDLNIINQCQPNCKTCQDQVCQKCDDGFVYYNYKCITLDCYDQVDQIKGNQYQMKSKLQDGKLVVNTKFDEISIGDCFIPRFYLVESLENPIVTHFFDQENVNLINENELELHIPINEDLGTKFETDEFYVRKYIFSVGLTLEQRLQYLLQGIAQVKISKSAEASMELRNQYFPVNEECCENQEVEVMGTAQVIKSELDKDPQTIEANITVIDPQYKDYGVVYKNSSMNTTNGQEELQLNEFSNEDNNLILYLTLPKGNNSKNNINTIQFDFDLLQSQRRFQQ